MMGARVRMAPPAAMGLKDRRDRKDRKDCRDRRVEREIQDRKDRKDRKDQWVPLELQWKQPSFR